MPTFHPRSQDGYSLIELSMVLVIMGLLVAGLLKGNELINQARLRNISSSFDNLSIAIQTYQERYSALPGDDPQAALRWPSTATSGNGDRVICGAYHGGDGGTPCSGSNNESLLLWQHLRSAGLIPGNGNQPPEHPAGGTWGVQNGALGLTGHALCANHLNAITAGSLDRQGDDGLANTGNLRAAAQSNTAALASSAPANAVYQEEGNLTYVLCKSL